MKITLVRHAEVIEKYQGKYNGHIDISISENGKKQAAKLGEKLKHENFDKVYCSDLLRAKQTLELFDLDIKPVYSEKLREKSWGKHEGKGFDEIQNQGIEYIDFKQWISALDGEDIQTYKNKIQNFFFETLFVQKEKNILVVTHAGVIKTLLSVINHTSLEESFKLKIPYLSCVILNISDKNFKNLNIDIKNIWL